MEDYINRWTLGLQAGVVKGPNGEVAFLCRGRKIGEWVLSTEKEELQAEKERILRYIDFFEDNGKLPIVEEE